MWLWVDEFFYSCVGRRCVGRCLALRRRGSAVDVLFDKAPCAARFAVIAASSAFFAASCAEDSSRCNSWIFLSCSSLSVWLV